jgi:hypothetical protein
VCSAGTTTKPCCHPTTRNGATYLSRYTTSSNVEPFTVKGLVGKLGDFGGIDPAALPGDLATQWIHIRDGRDQSFRKSLGWSLRNREGRYAGGWSLRAAGEDTTAKVAR